MISFDRKCSAQIFDGFGLMKCLLCVREETHFNLETMTLKKNCLAF